MTSEQVVPDKLRILYVIRHFPAISETYIKSELEALQDDYEIRIIARDGVKVACERHLPFDVVSDVDMIVKAAAEFRPHVLHTHWLTQLPILAKVARKLDVPFTVRSHSFDVLWGGAKGTFFDTSPRVVRSLLPPHLRDLRAMASDELCLGVVGFPFARPRLEKVGVPPEKFHEAWPVVDYARFHDRSPNGDGVMNVGAAIGKKRMDSYLELAARTPALDFDLYPLSFSTDQLAEVNRSMGSPVTFVPPVQPEDMAQEYKRHRWLVYMGSRTSRNVGWPMGIAEAQASGVGVCMENLRPDLKEYVGEAGYFFDTLEEAAAIISKPFPEEKRALGFEHAQRSDIEGHKAVLTDLWPRLA